MILAGVARIGNDVIVRFTPNGDAVANLSLAFNYGQKGQDGNKPSQWIDASLWGKRAEAMAPYLLKGVLVSVVLSDPHIETFQSKKGEGYKLVAKVLEIEFAGGGKRDDGGKRAESATHTSSIRAMDAQRPIGNSFDEMENDIPF